MWVVSVNVSTVTGVTCKTAQSEEKCMNEMYDCVSARARPTSPPISID